MWYGGYFTRSTRANCLFQAREDARYHRQRAICAAVERNRESNHVSNIMRELQETRAALETMQRAQDAWQMEQTTRLQEEFGRELAKRTQTANVETEVARELQQTRAALETMQRERDAWQEERGRLQEEFGRELAKRSQTANVQLEQDHGDDQTERQMVDQLLQAETQIEQLRQVNAMLVSGLQI
jgi:hypothetical protein